MSEDFEAEDFCTVVFDEFFTSSTSDNFVRHLLRLLWFVYPKLKATRLENLMKLTEPAVASSISGVTTDPATKLHSELKDKVSGHLANLAALQMEKESKAKALI